MHIQQGHLNTQVMTQADHVAASPWLSIISIVRNDASGLEDTLQSVSHENLSGIEYIVVDSSDDSDEVPAVLQSQSIQCRLLQTSPQGIFAAMNTGLHEATGQYVLFLNSGDLWSGRHDLLTLREILQDGSPAWAVGRAEFASVDGKWTIGPLWDFDREFLSHFSRGRFPPHQATLVKTSLLREVGGFDVRYSIVADYKVALQLARLTRPLMLDWVFCRFYEGGISTAAWMRSTLQSHRARVDVFQLGGMLWLADWWATTQQLLLRGAHRSPWILSTFLASVVVVAMTFTGVSVSTAVLLTALVCLQAFGGALLWRQFRPSRPTPVIELIGMGLGLGTAFAMVCGLFGAWWLSPTLSAGFWIARVHVARRPASPIAPLRLPELLAVLVGLVVVIATYAVAVRNYPLKWLGTWTGYHGDMAFFEAVAASVAKLGLGSSILMDASQLQYHSLVYGWAGQLTITANAEPFVVMTRLLPLIVGIATIAIASSWALLLSGVRWVPALSVALIVLGGFVGASYGSILNFDSPSQSMSVAWLLTFSVILSIAMQRSSGLWFLAPIAVLSFTLTGSKVSTGFVAVVGVIFLAAWGLLFNTPWRMRGLLLALTVAASSLVTFAALLARAANAGGLGVFSLLDKASSIQGLNPVITPRGVILGTLLLAIAVLPRWGGITWLMADRDTRHQPETAYAVGLALASIGTLLLLSGGFNDLWFTTAASAPLSVLSAVGVGLAASSLWAGGRKQVLASASLGLAIGGFSGFLWATGSSGMIGVGWRWLAPIAGVLLTLVSSWAISRVWPVSRGQHFMALACITLVFASLPSRLLYGVLERLTSPYSGLSSTVLFSPQSDFVKSLDSTRRDVITSDDLSAGAWLRGRAAPADLVATNATGTALVPALTRLPMYVADLPRQTAYGLPGQVTTAQDREKAAWDFIDVPSTRTVLPLCDAGVVWIWVDKLRTANDSWEPYAEVLESTGNIRILKLRDSACN